MSDVRWIKSSRSSNNGACVELAHLEHRIAARDSKNSGPTLSFPADAVHQLLHTLGPTA